MSKPRFIATLALSVLGAGVAFAAAGSMKGVQVQPDGKLAVAELPVPQPAAGEVLIKVRAAGVNPVDWKIANGRVGKVAGIDVAGVVDALGEGVTAVKVGDEVLGSARGSGGYAEYAILPVASLAKKPKKLSFEQAAGIPIAAETAYRALHQVAGIKKGQTVLIHGAAGGVGSAAVQIAKAAGARVIGTASANNKEFLKQLGVDEFIDYKSQKFEDVVKNADIVLNTANRETNERSVAVVREGGTLVSIIGPPPPEACAAAKIKCGMPDRSGPTVAEMLTKVGELVDAGKLVVHVDGVYSMADANQAWDKSREGHTRGKLIVRVQ
jgi:NADPH:quinone reductase-like Zn-dependent oxidoreductase